MAPYNPPDSHYGEVNAFNSQSSNLKFIGPGGKNFIRLTKKLDLEYIWWNMERNVFEIWGSFKKIEFSVQYLNSYMKTFHNKHCKGKSSDLLVIDQRQCKRSKII